jgi:hypothetical protein
MTNQNRAKPGEGQSEPPRELFLKLPWMGRGDEAYEQLCGVAELWQSQGEHFYAGMVFLRSVDAAWGNSERMLEAQHRAISNFEHVISTEAASSPSALAAIYKLQQTLARARWLFDLNDPTIDVHIRELNSELGQRLLKEFKNSEQADCYLVRGIVLTTRLDGSWITAFPTYEVPMGVEQFGYELILNIPSAFRLFVSDHDWAAAHEIIKVRPDAFTTPGLRGWRAVTLANIDPNEAVERFDEAADEFAADLMPVDDEERARRGNFWSSANKDLWAGYYRARARVIEAIRTPADVQRLLTRAAEAMKGQEAGWHNTDAARFNVLVKALTKMISDPMAFDENAARREYELEIRLSHESGEREDDQLAIKFIENAADAFRGYESDPVSEHTRGRLGIALDALARIPTIGPDVTEAVRPEIGKRVHSIMLGPVRTWMHQALEGITDEAELRKILLRLLQNDLPLYAHVRHGPIEYGKDIVVLLEIDGVVILRQYQVKCGDLNSKKWHETKSELEDMFLVPLSDFQLPVGPQRVEGILVTNGHANPFVEPIMGGWFKEQRERFQGPVSFRHLDGLISWIVENRLVNALRLALKECVKEPKNGSDFEPFHPDI